VAFKQTKQANIRSLAFDKKDEDKFLVTASKYIKVMTVKGNKLEASGGNYDKKGKPKDVKKESKFQLCVSEFRGTGYVSGNSVGHIVTWSKDGSRQACFTGHKGKGPCHCVFAGEKYVVSGGIGLVIMYDLSLKPLKQWEIPRECVTSVSFDSEGTVMKIIAGLNFTLNPHPTWHSCGPFYGSCPDHS